MELKFKLFNGIINYFESLKIFFKWVGFYFFYIVILLLNCKNNWFKNKTKKFSIYYKLDIFVLFAIL